MFKTSFEKSKNSMKRIDPFRQANVFDYIWGEQIYREDFYIDVAKEINGPIVDCGSGTGLVLHSLARVGFEAYGVERNKAMLKIAKEKLKEQPLNVQKRITLIFQDLINFSLENKFNLAIFTPNTFRLYLYRDTQIKILKNVYNSLTEKGKLLFIVENPLNLPENRTVPRKIIEKYVPKINKTLIIKTNIDFNEKSSILTSNMFNELRGKKGKRVKRSSIKNIKQKVLKKEEMEELFTKVGFIIEKVYGDFDKGKYLQSSPALILIARKNNLLLQKN